MNRILRALAAGLMSVAVAASPAAKGRVLLLDSRQLIEGEIELADNLYHIRRDGGETVVPAARVLAVCDDREGAYRILSAKCDPKNVRERLKMAEWCHNNSLAKQAIAEARAAVQLRPNDPIAQRFLRFCERAALEKPNAAAIAKPAEPPVAPDSVDCSPEALQHFCTRVQPVLMNACVTCHAEHSQFRLQRVRAETADGRLASFHNLAAALAQLDRTKPAASPLLVKAIAAHGGGAIPALRPGSPAFQQLETWAKMLTSESATTEIPQPKPTVDGGSGFGSDRAEAKPAGPKDPFDPAEFNKKNYPDKK